MASLFSPLVRALFVRQNGTWPFSVFGRTRSGAIPGSRERKSEKKAETKQKTRRTKERAPAAANGFVFSLGKLHDSRPRLVICFTFAASSRLTFGIDGEAQVIRESIHQTFDQVDLFQRLLHRVQVLRSARNVRRPKLFAKIKIKTVKAISNDRPSFHYKKQRLNCTRL